MTDREVWQWGASTEESRIRPNIYEVIYTFRPVFKSMGEENNIMQVACQYGSQTGLLTIRAIKRSIFDEDQHYYYTSGTRLSISCRVYVNGFTISFELHGRTVSQRLTCSWVSRWSWYIIVSARSAILKPLRNKLI